MKKFDEKAAQNFFPEDDNENLKLEVKCNKDNKISGVSFVFNNTTNVRKNLKKKGKIMKKIK